MPIILVISSYILGLAWISYVSALLGYFFGVFLWIYSSLFVIFAIKLHKKIKIKYFNYTTYALLFLLTLLFSLFTTPTIFSGRDQGALSQAAIRLSQNHQLEFSTPVSEEFFQIYGPGRALNFPGFYYTEKGELITQFPFTYTSWLAMFYSSFGITGFVLANAILFFFFLISIYELFRLFIKTKFSSFILLAFILTSFSFSWFLKFTLTENMALAFLWFSIYSLVKFQQKPEKLFYYSYLLSSILLVFTRIEGLAFFIIGLGVLFWNKNTKNFLLSDWKKNIALPGVAFLVLLIANFFKNIHFYRELARALFKSGEGSGGNSLIGILDSFLYMLQVHSIYGMIGFFAIGLLAMIYFGKIKKYIFLLPLIVVIPSFIYLIDSNISSDHPWMLRRFEFSILPAFIFYSALLLGYMHKQNLKKNLAYSITGLLIFISLPAFTNYIFFSENKSLLNQTKELSKNFSTDDLILIDQEASGDNWSMISAPMNSLFDKNAAYFFNPEDLSKINQDKFKNIYIITPNKNIDFYKNNINQSLDKFNEYFLQTPRLENSNKKSKEVRLPDKQMEKVEGVIFKIEK